MIDIKIIKSEDNLDEFRNLYFDSISEPQELFLELLINPYKELNKNPSQKYLIRIKDIDIGYCIVNNEHIILEFYLIDNYIPICEEIFKLILIKLSTRKAFCKSFDNIFLKCCITYQKRLKLEGVLFRDMIEKNVDLPHPNLYLRIGESKDFTQLSLFKEGFFENDGELKVFLDSKSLFCLLIDDEIIGCGIFSRIIKNRPDFDIGMVVHPKYRRKGFGTYIINHLKNYCLENNWRPICGCAIENIGSRRTLEKAGFISKHNLIQFEF